MYRKCLYLRLQKKEAFHRINCYKLQKYIAYTSHQEQIDIFFVYHPHSIHKKDHEEEAYTFLIVAVKV